MKIAVIQFDLPDETKGGVAYLVHYFANRLVSAGHRVVIFTTSPKPKDATYEVCQIKLPQFIKKIYALKAIIFPVTLFFKDFSKFDILHSHGDDQFIFTTTPIIRTFHGSAFDEAFNATTIFRFLYQFFYIYPSELLSGLRADINVTVSKHIKKRYPFRIEVIHNGVDLSIFKPGPKNPCHAILFVGGTLRGRKRGRFLVKIYNKQIKKAIKGVELWLVTKERFQGEGIRCFDADLAREELAQLYQKAWLLCLPSKYEGFGLPYIEAMASGLAIVTTPNLGATEILEYGKYGCITDKRHLASSIIKLLKNEEKRQSYEKLGIERTKEFSAEVNLNKYLKIFEKLYKAPQ